MWAKPSNWKTRVGQLVMHGVSGLIVKRGIHKRGPDRELRINSQGTRLLNQLSRLINRDNLVALRPQPTSRMRSGGCPMWPKNTPFDTILLRCYSLIGYSNIGRTIICTVRS